MWSRPLDHSQAECHLYVCKFHFTDVKPFTLLAIWILLEIENRGSDVRLSLPPKGGRPVPGASCTM